MKALLCKEFLMMKKGIAMPLLLIAVFSIWGFTGQTAFFLMIPMFISTMQYGYLNSDEQSHWKQYSLTLPYGRSAIVSSKYLVMVILALASSVIISVLYAISAEDATAKGTLAYAVLAFAIGLVYPTLILPIAYRFGTEKGRVCFAIIGGLTGALAGFFMSFISNEYMTVYLAKLSSSASIVPFIVLGFTAFLFAFSWLLSVKIYSQIDL